MKSQVIQVFPPSNTHPFRNCNAVLLRCRNDTENFGVVYSLMSTFTRFLLKLKHLDFAQVQTVFMPKTKKILPNYLAPVPFLYVCYFDLVALPDQCPGIQVGLCKVQHAPPSSIGVVVPLSDVIHAVELVPVYSTTIPGVSVCSETCMEVYVCPVLCECICRQGNVPYIAEEPLNLALPSVLD